MAIIIVFVFLCLLLCDRALIINHTAKWFLICFHGVWGIVLTASTFQPYGLYLPSDFTYFLLILNVVCYSLGFYFKSRKLKRNLIDTIQIEKQIIWLSDNKIYRIVLIVACLFSIYYFSIFLVVMKVSDSLGEVRTQFYDGSLYGSLFTPVNALLLNPMQILTYPLAVYGCLYRRKTIVIPMMIFLICYNSLGGGRFGYVKIFYSFIFILLCVSKINYKKLIAICSFGGVVLLLLLSFITASRYDSNQGSVVETVTNGIDDTMMSVATYACGASVAFDYSLTEDYASKIGGNTYGGCTGGGVVQLIYIISNKLGMPFESPLQRLAYYKQEQYINVGPDLRFNALYTAVLFFYLDFGVFGVIFLPFIFGLICSWLICKFVKLQNVFFLIIVNYCFILTMFSITDYNLATYSPIVTLLLLFYLGKKKFNIGQIKMKKLKGR